MLTGVALLFAAQMLDVIDGVIYRYRGNVAIRGAYFDRFNHEVIYPLTYGCLGVAAYRITDEWVYVALGLAANQLKDALEALQAYEAKLEAQHPKSISIIRTSEFFSNSYYKRLRYAWATPLYLFRYLAAQLMQHIPNFAIMALAIWADRTGELVIYYTAMYALRFFSQTTVAFGVTLWRK